MNPLTERIKRALRMFGLFKLKVSVNYLGTDVLSRSENRFTEARKGIAQKAQTSTEQVDDNKKQKLFQEEDSKWFSYQFLH